MSTATHTWRKSTHSSNGSDCVEVRSDLAGIRDSKNPGPALHTPTTALVAAIKAGRLG
ncbi:DUF397 domain-containing protein [Actinokineospora pegani]|uniref:DUF397 domain-containing protein n=1 Tax=Actinokineospora pegani TaxID=2654637 RepID=UPI0012EAD4BE|nr:DUF397 domain-containing protein [Actinokineospora pegani]